MENRLDLYMFGSYTLQYGKRSLTLGRCATAKSVQLLQILLMYGEKGIEKDKLAHMLYEWKDVTDANNSLNSLIYRLRNQLLAAGLPKEEYIVTKGGICRWQANVPTWVDTAVFENCIHAAEHAGGEEKRKLLEEAVRLYRGELLPAISGELWVIVESVRLKRMYTGCVQQLAEMMDEKREYGNMYTLFANAAEIYPFDEWQEKQIDVLQKMKQYEEAFRLYKETVKMYRDELGTPPSPNMYSLLQKMSGKVNTEMYDGGGIQSTLCESGWKRGAYYCGYPSFVEMYRLMCRLVERSGQLVCLMVCTLYYENAEYELDPKVENSLKMAIENSLRRGDVCTRYSWNQYLLLVPVTSKENCDLIFGRIETLFHTFNERKECRIRCDAVEVCNG